MQDMQAIVTLLSSCPLVSDVSIQGDNDQVAFIVIVDDVNDRDEVYYKCAKVDAVLLSFGVKIEQIMYNDCEELENEGAIDFSKPY